MIKLLSRILALTFTALHCSSGKAGGGTEIKVLCSTTKGDIVIAVYPDWAPLGAARFIELVKDNFYTDIALYRSVPKFLTQFGISDKQEKKHWHHSNIPDDPLNSRGIKKYFVSYAGGGKDTRSTQLFIAFEDLPYLGKSPWEVAFGEVVAGRDVVDSFYQGNGDIPPFGKGPDQQLLHQRGNSYIRENFPLTDFIQQCSLAPAEEEVKTTPTPPSPGLDSPSQTKTDKDAFLRKSGSDVKVNTSGSGSSTRPALIAVVVLLIALFVLCSLYQYHSATSPKSQ